MNPEEETDCDRGLVYDKVPEILTRGHQVSQKRVAKIEERAAYAKNLILPTAYPFTKLVRVYSIVLSFNSKCIKGREILSRLLAEGRMSTWKLESLRTRVPTTTLPLLVSPAWLVRWVG